MSAQARRAGADEHAGETSARPRPTGLTPGALKRARILAATSKIIDTQGIERASVTRIIKQARVPRACFYQEFTGRDDALCALLQNALERSRACVLGAGEQEVGWQRRTRAGLLALLSLYEAEPEIGRLCLTHSRHLEPQIQRMRARALEQLARHVDAGTTQGRQPPGTLTAECTVAGVLAVIEARLAGQRAPGLRGLAGELMSFIVLPYRSAAAAREDHTRQGAGREPREGSQNGAHPGLRITYRTMCVLAAIAARPGLSNIAVGEQAGIADQGQISKLLKRLAALGLVQNTGGGQELGAANAWELTEHGRNVERSILEHHTPSRK